MGYDLGTQSGQIGQPCGTHCCNATMSERDARETRAVTVDWCAESPYRRARQRTVAPRASMAWSKGGRPGNKALPVENQSKGLRNRRAAWASLHIAA